MECCWLILIRMLATEPMVLCMALFASYVYGLLFFQLEAFSVVFFQNRGYSLFVSTLPLLGLLTGVICALAINFANQPLYAAAVAKNNGRPLPEARLPPLIVGGVLFSAGLFWFGWTSGPEYSWALPTVAAGESDLLISCISLASGFLLTRSTRRFHRRRLQHHISTMHQLSR